MNNSTSNNITSKTELLAAYIEGKSSETENDIVDKWLREDKGNEEILMQLSKIYFANRTKQSISKRDILSSYHGVKKKIKKKERKYQLKKRLLTVACIISVLSTLSTSYLLVNKTTETTHIPEGYDLITVESKIGMRSNFHLPDGSQVYLNSGGCISYPSTFEQHERRISLQGEAYFKIKSDVEHPFFVDLPDKNVSIKVLGTEFNLEAYEKEDEIRTTLISGKVNILLSDKDLNIIEEYELRPLQKALLNTKTMKSSIINTDGSEETAWMQGKLIFKDTPLPEVLRELSHFYDVNFKIQDKIINTYRFTGVFDNRQLIQVLDYLKISSSIDYSVVQFTAEDKPIKKRTIVILKKTQR